MRNALDLLIGEAGRPLFRDFVRILIEGGRRFLLRNDLLLLYEEFRLSAGDEADSGGKLSIAGFLSRVQELVVRESSIVAVHRYAIAKYRFYVIHRDGIDADEISVGEYLDIKDAFVLGTERSGDGLRIDFLPFYDYSPIIKDTKSIGNGIRFLSRYLSSNIFQNPADWNEKLFRFIKLHSYRGQQLLANGNIIEDFQSFYSKLQAMLERISSFTPDTPSGELMREMRMEGFEPGWGNTAGRIAASMQILYDLLNEPDDTLLESFIQRVPMPLISRIAIISPHGWFAQDNVLGRPDTGGQVIYILDQVRALEKHLIEAIRLTGIDVAPQIVVITRLIPEAENTTCGMRREKIFHTENAWILRIPFRTEDLSVVPHWISRFHVWPYLERFADDAITEMTGEFEGKPDLIIGNYSDGNIVATRMSDRLGVIQCNIAHALEKTKYLFSDLYWREMEGDYNFSLQFTADMIAMNKCDFIVSSTRQEITGTEYAMGQYESYQFFSLPGLYQATGGINLFTPKFNVIPPGVDEEVYFPYYETGDSVSGDYETWERRVFEDAAHNIHGTLDDPGKPPVFTMARLDKIKNITGLIEAFGASETLRRRYNLIIAAGSPNLEDSNDAEEKEQIEVAHSLIAKYDLHGSIRWLPGIEKAHTGVVYRVMAARRGVFVQPALFEAFGLTILEAMLSGLPTFATKFGGPIEIIEDGLSGFLINTSRPELIAGAIENFSDGVERDEALWEKISRGGVERVRKHFNWTNYSERLVNLAKLYGFWRYSVTGTGKIRMNLYSDSISHFLFRERAASRR